MNYWRTFRLTFSTHMHGSYSLRICMSFYTGEFIYHSFISAGSTYHFKEHLYTGFYTDFIALYTGDLFNWDVF